MTLKFSNFLQLNEGSLVEDPSLSVFIPTFLYIKQHKVTGKLYFGKTTKKDPVKYTGSGIYWNRHLKTHGKDIETLWYCLFTEEEECKKFALMLSKQEDIVNSDLWTNLIFETGIERGVLGLKHSAETKMKLSLAHKGKKKSPEAIAKQITAQLGKKHSLESIAKMSASKTGKKMSPEFSSINSLSHLGLKPSIETRKKMSIAHKGRIHSPESIKKSSDSRKGAKRSPESRERMRNARLEYLKNNPTTILHDRIVALYNTGLKIKQVSELINCSTSNVKRIWAIQRKIVK